MKLKAFAAATLVSMGWAVATPASAEILNLNVCWSSCENVSNDSALVATLNIVQNGSDVDFTFSNLTSNLGADANANTFISELWFSYDGANTLTGDDIGNYGGTNNGPTLTDANFTFGDTTNAGLTFQVDLNLPTAEGNDRFTDGETLTWTITDVNVADFLVSSNEEDGGQLAMVHIQSLASEGNGSVKFVDGNGTSVSEPGILGLFGVGLVLLGFMRRRAIA